MAEYTTAAEYEAAFDRGEIGPCEHGSIEWHRRQAILLLDDRPPTWWWLSFIDTTLPYREEDDYPGGPRWAGVCIVAASNLVQATHMAHALGCNPGGQVSGYPFTIDKGWTMRPEFVGRLFAGDEGLLFANRELDELIEEDPSGG